MIKLPALITGSFVALYMTAIAATNGNNHSIDRGLGPNISGSIKVAITNITLSTFYPLAVCVPRRCDKYTALTIHKKFSRPAVLVYICPISLGQP